VLKHHGVNSTFDEVSEKEHWWWDTELANDGGVLNDPKMRSFFDHCSRKHARSEKDPLEQSSTQTCSTETCTGFGDSRMPVCSLVVVNPSMHFGNCGLRVLQQVDYLERSVLDLYTGSDNSCEIVTNGNIRRLAVNVMSLRKYRDCSIIRIDGFILDINRTDEISFDVCWGYNELGQLLASPCETPIHPLREKHLATTGPVRKVYASPFVIVFGTLCADFVASFRDLAVYIANSHLAAHDTSVNVMTDVQYLSEETNSFFRERNLIFIGCPLCNYAMETICVSQQRCNVPVNFTSYNSFTLARKTFHKQDQAVMFTFPLVSQSKNVKESIPRLGLCIHVNSPLATHQISRLAWPVIPPMVRTPFANYIPDVIVVDFGVWSKGFGAVLFMGIWNSTWNIQGVVDANNPLHNP
jgi:hypothetical protein